jgi:hypothetical protein
MIQYKKLTFRVKINHILTVVNLLKFYYCVNLQIKIKDYCLFFFNFR